MNKADKENKEKQDKYQVILSGLLRDDDNKYCVDCDAKGPRWASWNLGVFLCIRCAGIHRNLGVHISKVKSVTLDAWSAEQVAMMQDMGNSRARAVYEANIPDNFRRPQTDSGVEAFIRSKYEQKKYIASEWVPPKPRTVVIPPEDSNRDKKAARPRANFNVAPQKNATGGGTNGGVPPPVSAEALIRAEGSQPPIKPSELSNKSASAEVDLLGLDVPVAPVSSTSASDDLFTDFLSSTSNGNNAMGGASSVNHASSQPGGGATSELADAGLFNGGETKKSSKDAIMALYGPSAPAGGAYMSTNQQMMNMMAPPSTGMIGMLPAGTGMHQMVGAGGGMNMQPMMMMGPGGMMPAGMMNMPQHQQQQYILAQQQHMGGMPGAAVGMQQQYAMPPQHMYNMHQVQNQMASMNLMTSDPTGGMGGPYKGPGAGVPPMPAGQGFVQHPAMASYPVPAAAPGNVWQ